MAFANSSRLAAPAAKTSSNRHLGALTRVFRRASGGYGRLSEFPNGPTTRPIDSDFAVRRWAFRIQVDARQPGNLVFNGTFSSPTRLGVPGSNCDPNPRKCLSCHMASRVRRISMWFSRGRVRSALEFHRCWGMGDSHIGVRRVVCSFFLVFISGATASFAQAHSR